VLRLQKLAAFNAFLSQAYTPYRHASLTGAYLTDVHVKRPPYLSRRTRIVSPAGKHPLHHNLIRLEFNALRYIPNVLPLQETLCVSAHPCLLAPGPPEDQTFEAWGLA